MCHSCDIILQALWTPVYVIVTLWIVMKIWMTFYGIFVWTMDVWYCLLHYNYIFICIRFFWYLICYCCLLTLTVLCFSVCCLFTCPLCCCFLCGSSTIGTKYPLTLFTTIHFLATLSICCFSSLLCTLLSNVVFVIL